MQQKSAVKRELTLDAKEKWQKRQKRGKSYSDPATASKLLKHVDTVGQDTRGQDTTLRRELGTDRLVRQQHHLVDQSPNELDSDNIERALNMLRIQYGSTLSGLQSVGLGSYTAQRTAPRFTLTYEQRFVQIMNIGDHWICVTNVFGQTLHDVYVFLQLVHNDCNFNSSTGELFAARPMGAGYSQAPRAAI